MSFQSYLDNAERKTGVTPAEFVDLARERGFGPDTKATPILEWLKNDHGLARGHGMALVHVIKNGPGISDKHVGKPGPHGDASDTLDLRGLAARGLE